MTDAMTVDWIKLGNPVANHDFSQNPNWVTREKVGWLVGPVIGGSQDSDYETWRRGAPLAALRVTHATAELQAVIDAAISAIRNGDGRYQIAVIEWTVKEPVFAHDRDALRYTAIRLVDDETYEQRDCRWADDAGGNRTITTHKIDRTP